MRPPQIAFPALLQDFFHQRLVTQLGASAQTIASYRDTFELLLRYTEQSMGWPPSTLTLDDLDAPRVLAFLDHLETERGNSPRTRNLRLTSIRSFMRYASVRDPTALPVALRVRAIPTKRFDRAVLGFLSREEVEALLDAPDRATWSGQRDAVMFAALYNTGAVSPRSRGCASLTCSSIARQPCTCTARDARSESFRCGRVRRSNFARGCSASIAAPLRRSSPIVVAHACRVQASRTASASLSRRPRSAAPRSPGAESRLTPCATRRRCTSSKPVWTSRSSRCGSVTRIRPQRTSTSRLILQ